MFTFTPTRNKSQPSKVHYSQYIRNENTPPDTDAKPVGPTAIPPLPQAE